MSQLNHNKKIRIALIGLGNRALKYYQYIKQHSDEAEMVAVVEPDNARMTCFMDTHTKDDLYCFSNSDDFYAAELQLDAVIIASPDAYHFDQCMKAIERHWHVLLEKPIATTPDECRQLVEAAQREQVLVNVCYVLRFHPYYRKVKEIIDSGKVGKVMAVNYTNYIGVDRTQHVYVRGPWANKATSGPVVLSKCSHDTDYILWVTGQGIKHYSSFGSLGLFRPEMAPQDSADRCVDCSLESQCPFSAVTMYKRRKVWISNFPIPEGKTFDEVIDSELRDGQYGRCAYKCGNDVFDRQSIIMELNDGTIVNFAMEFLTRKDCRKFSFHCSNAEIEASDYRIEVHYFNGEDEVFDFSHFKGMPFHANADMEVVRNFLAACRGEEDLVAPISESLKSHLFCLNV